MGKERICFIDDSPREIKRFIRYFSDKFTLYTGTSFEEVKEKLRSTNPDLFVLDLYFPYGEPHTVTSEMFEGFWNLPDISEIYSEDRNKLLENTWGVMVGARELMKSVLQVFRQGPEGGIDLLKQVQEEYPVIPVVFYTRKGSLQDAVKCIKLGASDVIQKPHPLPGQKEESVVKNERRDIIYRFHMAMKNQWHFLDDLKYTIADSKTMDWKTKKSANKLLLKLRESLTKTDNETARKTFSKLQTTLQNISSIAGIISLFKSIDIGA